jgi:hypothetical protein
VAPIRRIRGEACAPYPSAPAFQRPRLPNSWYGRPVFQIPDVTPFLPVIALNDDWGGDPALVAAFASAGAFPLTNEGRDAALLRSLNGAHTARVFGGSGGIVLFECYGGEGGVGSRLVNLSARSQINSDNGALIAGVTVTGATSKTVLIRGLGPALGVFGVRDALIDPKLEIFDAAHLVVAENDNWYPGLATTEPQVAFPSGLTSSGNALDEIAKAVGAMALSFNWRDAAVLVTLPPGSYTAVVSGVGGATGEAQIEIYEVP